MIAKVSSDRLATGHCRSQPSARSIASPQLRVARTAASPATTMSPSGTRGSRYPERQNPMAKSRRAEPATAPPTARRGQGRRAACRIRPADTVAQGTATAANAIASQGQASPAGAAFLQSFVPVAARRRRKCSISNVLPLPTASPAPPTRPLPSSGFTASFASAPPVKGSPPSPSASTAAGSSTGHQRGRAAAATPIARNSPPLTRMWCAAEKLAPGTMPGSPAAHPMPSAAASNPIWLTLE